MLLRRPERRQPLREALAATGCMVLTAMITIAAGALVFSARIGPIVATLDEAAGRGVHAGDFLALPLLATAAALFVIGLGCADRVVGRAATSHR